MTPYQRRQETIAFVEPILNGHQYDALIDSHARPYVVRVSTENWQAAVLIYGSQHKKGRQLRDEHMVWLLDDPKLDPLRFLQLLKDVGWTNARQGAG